MDQLERYLHARHAVERNKEMAKRNPNQAMIEAELARADKEIASLDHKIEHAKVSGIAWKPLEVLRAQQIEKRQQWRHAEAFKDKEEDRLALSGMSDKEAQDILSALPKDGKVVLDQLAARVDRMQGKTLQLLESYGLESKETVTAWRQAYRYYVPLHRDDAHPDAVGNGSGQGFSVRGSFSQKAIGSNAAVTNIMAHVVLSRTKALARGEKNRVSQRIYLLIKKYPNDDFWSLEKPTKKILKNGLVETVIDPLFASHDNTLMLRINGRDAAITFNPHNERAVRLAKSLKNLDGVDLDFVERYIGKATRWFASINTQYNPIFGVVNLLRDTQDAMLNLSSTEIAGRQKEVLYGIVPAARAIAEFERTGKADSEHGKAYLEFRAAGGTTGHRDLYARAEDMGNKLLKDLRSIDRGNASKAAHALVDGLSEFNTVMENCTRLSAFMAARKAGFSAEKSASIAKNLTVNFNRKGAATSKVGAFYAFFNASLQGTARIAQTLTGPAGRKIMVGGVALGAISTLLGLCFMGRDDWDNIPDFVKERSLIIPTGKSSYLTIPMPLGYLIFPNIGRQSVEMMWPGDAKSKGRHVGELALTVAGALAPISGGDPLQIITPTAFDWMVSLYGNKDWTGRKIYQESFSNDDVSPGFTRAKDAASNVSRVIAEQLNRITGGTEYTAGAFSPTPDQIDYVIGQLTGGAGREVVKTLQIMSKPEAKFIGMEVTLGKQVQALNKAKRQLGKQGGDQSKETIKGINLTLAQVMKNANQQVREARER